jgi:cytochrome P450
MGQIGQVNLPPGPQQPATWQMLQWIARPLKFLESCAQQYGDRFTVRIGVLQPAVFVSQPSEIQSLFRADAQSFVIGQANYILQPLLGDQSVILLDGDRHQRQRQLLMPPFHGERMRAYGQVIQTITQHISQSWKSGDRISVRATMQDISLQVILQAVFGFTPGTRDGNPANLTTIQDTVRHLLDLTGSPLSSSLLFFRWLQHDWGAWSPWGSFLRQKATFDRAIYAEIHHRHAHPDDNRQDILAMLMAARDEDGNAMTEVELRDELVTLLVAGHETTASALSWALYLLHCHPESYRQLRQELDTVPWDNPDEAIATVLRLPYLDAVCSETLRLYPIAPIAFPRKLKETMAFGGYDLPPDTFLVACIYLAHRNPKIYPQPEQFQPERFLNRQFSPYEFLPFGGGNRRCIGMAFALFEMKLVLATLLRQHQFQIVGDRPIYPQRRGVTLAPPNHLELQIV